MIGVPAAFRVADAFDEPALRSITNAADQSVDFVQRATLVDNART